MMDGMPTLYRSWVFLPRHKRVILTNILPSFTPSRLFEVGDGDIPHFKKIRDVNVFSSYLGPYSVIIYSIPCNVHVRVARVPTIRGQVCITLKLDVNI